MDYTHSATNAVGWHGECALKAQLRSTSIASQEPMLFRPGSCQCWGSARRSGGSCRAGLRDQIDSCCDHWSCLHQTKGMRRSSFCAPGATPRLNGWMVSGYASRLPSTLPMVREHLSGRRRPRALLPPVPGVSSRVQTDAMQLAPGIRLLDPPSSTQPLGMCDWGQLAPAA